MSRERDQMEFPSDDVDTICSFRWKSKCKGGSVWKSVADTSFKLKKNEIEYFRVIQILYTISFH